MDNPCHQPSGVRVRSLAGLDRAVQDPVIADPQPMPWGDSRERPGVQVRGAAGQGLQRQSGSIRVRIRVQPIGPSPEKRLWGDDPVDIGKELP